MSSTTPVSSTSPDQEIGPVVGRLASALYRGYAANESKVVAQLARLRDAQRRPLGADPDTWWVFERIPEALRGQEGRDGLSRSEATVFAALGLFSVHQQAKRQQSMHQQGVAFGTAVRRLSLDAGIDAPVRRRFQALGEVHDLPGALIHLRGLVTQMRGVDVGLDYGALARDLYRLQSATTRDGVRQRWARQFYVHQTATPDQSGDPSGETTEKDS